MKKPGAANSTSGLRGDYTQAANDWTVPQDWASHTAEEHGRWCRLYARQHALAERYAAPQVLDGLHRLDASAGIPDFARANRVLNAATGWQLVAVPGFIPDEAFFDHLAHRRFPVSRWLREERELDYLVEPDVFHDFFGHVPMLLDPVFADFMVKYGEAGPRAIAMGALPMLARVYWYTVEFGLINEGAGLKAFGAGILSSAGETVYAVSDPEPLRLAFDPARIMRTAYAIDSFQRVYFVISSVEQLMRGLVDLDFGPIYQTWRDSEPIAAGALLPGERSL
jgi:phenylalanine-4-hydroxylase